MKVSGYVLSAVLGAVRTDGARGPPESFTPTHRHGTSTWCLPSTQFALHVVSEGLCWKVRKELHGSEGRVRGREEQKRALAAKHPWFSFHIRVDSMKRHGTRAGAGPGSPAGSEEVCCVGVI